MSKLILHGLLASMSKVIVRGPAAEPERLQYPDQTLPGSHCVHRLSRSPAGQAAPTRRSPLVSGSDDDDRTAPDPPAEEREPHRTEQGAMKEIEDRERRGREKGVRRDEGPLRFEILHDLGMRGQNPARAGDVDPRIAAD